MSAVADQVSLKPQGEDAPIDTLQTCLYSSRRLKESFYVF